MRLRAWKSDTAACRCRTRTLSAPTWLTAHSMSFGVIDRALDVSATTLPCRLFWMPRHLVRQVAVPAATDVGENQLHLRKSVGPVHQVRGETVLLAAVRQDDGLVFAANSNITLPNSLMW